nr:acyl-CoA N-acyltransferase [Tanacetum cinerariifolium]
PPQLTPYDLGVISETIGCSSFFNNSQKLSRRGLCACFPCNIPVSFGLAAIWAQSLTVYDCQALIDRGWTRTGSSLWKPEMEKTCCPSYTIRLQASDFVPSKAQVQVSKRMQRFLDGSLNVKKPDEQIETSCNSSSLSNTDSFSSVQTDVIVDTINYLSDQIDSVVLTCTELGEFPSDIQFSKASAQSVAPTKRTQAEGTQDLFPLIYVPSSGDITVPPCGFGSFHQ